MAWGWWVLVGFLAVILVAGIVVTVAERRGWITNPELQAIVRKAYGLDRD